MLNEAVYIALKNKGGQSCLIEIKRLSIWAGTGIIF